MTAPRIGIGNYRPFSCPSGPRSNPTWARHQQKCCLESHFQSPAPSSPTHRPATTTYNNNSSTLSLIFVWRSLAFNQLPRQRIGARMSACLRSCKSALTFLLKRVEYSRRFLPHIPALIASCPGMSIFSKFPFQEEERNQSLLRASNQP